MTHDCEACRQVISQSSKYVVCCSCMHHYHPECVKVKYTTLSKSEILRWTCPTCKSKVPKTDNTHTPVRQQASTSIAVPAEPHSSRGNVTLRPQNIEIEKRSKSHSPTSNDKALQDPHGDALAALTREIRLLRDDMVEIKSHLSSLSTCVANCASRLDEYDSKLAWSQAKISTLEKNELENVLLRQRIDQLEEKLSGQTQSVLRNEIELQGINEHTNENLFHIVKLVAIKIGMELPESEVDDVLRVGPRRPESSHPRPVVLRFVRHMKRQEFLKAARIRRNITTEDIEVAGRRNKIFLNERLTKEKRQLFREARLLKSAQGYKHCWTTNGNIFIRKKERGPVIAIRNSADLDGAEKRDQASVAALCISPELAPGLPTNEFSAVDSSACETFTVVD